MRSYHSYQAGCLLRVSGPDASEFLQGQFSNDLSRMEVGEVVYGLWLNRKGKIVADSFVLRRGEEDYWVVSYHCSEEVVFERLDSYLIMEEVELERFSAAAKGLCIFGSMEGRNGDVLIPEVGRFVEEDGVIVFWGRRSMEPSLEVLMTVKEAGSAFEEARENLCGRDCQEVAEEGLTVRAIQSEVPRIGLAFGELDLPQELGLEKNAVSFNKGCYLGQEVMARLHAMGKVRKSLVRFCIEGLITEELPLEIFNEAGKKMGSLREVAYSESGCIGLGVLSHSFTGGELRAGGTPIKPDDGGKDSYERV